MRKIELVDTPGFNSPDEVHARAARKAFRDAHVVLWLLDATQPLKDSERTEIEGIRKASLPLLVLVNKIDRLPEGGLEPMLTHVRAGLDDAGLATEAPVIAFSARLALAGKNGDEGALERSRFGDVDRLVSDVLSARSGLLRERALLARLSDAAETLLTSAEAKEEDARRERARDEERRERWMTAAAELTSRRALALRQLERASSDLARDLARGDCAGGRDDWRQERTALRSGARPGRGRQRPERADTGACFALRRCTGSRRPHAPTGGRRGRFRSQFCRATSQGLRGHRARRGPRRDSRSVSSPRCCPPPSPSHPSPRPCPLAFALYWKRSLVNAGPARSVQHARLST